MRDTLTTNTPAVGTATIGGTSRMILTSAEGLFNVNGNTTVAAPVTFDTGSVTTVAAAAETQWSTAMRSIMAEPSPGPAISIRLREPTTR